MTVEEYEKHFDGHCKLCEKPKKNLVLDHDHKTGRIRGAVCRPCNLFLGKIENPELMERVEVYLKEVKE